MATITGEYLGKLRCRAVHGPSGAVLDTDAPSDNAGQDDAFSPTDLCATSLLTCMATLMGIKAEGTGYDLTGMKMEVHKHMSTTPPRRIARLELAFHFPRAAEEGVRLRLQRAAETCPVHHSLHPDVVVETTYDWPAG